MTTTETSRRDFLKILGVGVGSLALSDFKLLAADASPYKPKLGIQLYTVRRAIEKDFEGTMSRIADMGFKGVEYYPLPENITAEHAGKVCKELGLEVLGMHTPLPIGEDRDKAVKTADALNCKRVIYPGWPKGVKPTDPDVTERGMEIFKNTEALKRTVEQYNEIAAFMKTKGLRFGLHNHWWEFEKKNGIIPFYYLLKHLDDIVFFEIDTYWAKTAGQNPAKAVADFGNRVELLHIKDGPAVKGATMFAHVPAGEGTLDFPAIAKAGGRNIDWMIVEFDEYDKDIFDGIRKSYSYLTKKGLAEGKK